MGRMPVVVRALVLAVPLGGTIACSDSSGPGQLSPDHLRGVIVSPPVGGFAASRGSVGALSSGVGVVYVSLAPGAVPTGLAAAIRDQANGQSVTTPMVDGGFDPVALPGSAGDTLVLSITRSGGVDPLRTLEVVPIRRPPTVVRTNLPSGGRDVPLNTSVVLVFSEPIDSATVSKASVQLLRNSTSVAGTPRLDNVSQLQLEFRPASLLQGETTYQLLVTQAIRDLNGEPLASDLVIPFTTAVDSTAPRILVDASRDGGVWWFPQGGGSAGNGFDPLLDHQGKPLADSLRAMGYRVDELPRPIYQGPYGITLDLLQPYDIVIRAGVWGGYGPEEIAAYQAYVGGGGKLLLLADHFALAPGQPDSLGLSFGLVFAGATGGELQFTAGYPITNGVGPLFYQAGSGLLSVPASAQVLGSLSAGSFLDLNNNGLQDTGEPSAPAVFGVMSYGAGRIVFCGDTNLWELIPQPLLSNVLAWFAAP